MASTPKRRYWDACAWIALIIDEKIHDPADDPNGRVVEHRGQMCRQLIHAAQKGVVEVVTSSFSLVEVCKSSGVKDGSDDKIKRFFEHSFVLIVNVDAQVGELARKLMREEHPGLKPADATHLASAVIGRAEELHTFDRKLLNLSGKIIGLDGTPLRICKPAPPALPAPLLEGVTSASTQGDT
jgi:predicted nucleic acid-binding protein